MRDVKIGIVDTTFAKIDMGKIATSELRDNFESVSIVRRTVPGMKDLAVACKKLFEEQGCDVCVAFAMPGKEAIDEQCAHEASQGIMLAQLLCSRHIVEVFVHESEAKDEKELAEICFDRCTKHARNAVLLAGNSEELSKRAGTGARQGKQDVGGIETIVH
ncbi:riboflavin synthase [Candidatus Micrarchaeota archaeon]|nr:riboflavin synthase [Candidatus Micrarchaeota archaeon]